MLYSHTVLCPFICGNNNSSNLLILDVFAWVPFNFVCGILGDCAEQNHYYQYNFTRLWSGLFSLLDTCYLIYFSSLIDALKQNKTKWTRERIWGVFTSQVLGVCCSPVRCFPCASVLLANTRKGKGWKAELFWSHDPPHKKMI